jgi:hypothetical protein
VLRSAARLAAATFVVAAAGLVVPAPADAAMCSTASGVTVVVDFRQLGGGVPTFCDSGGAGENAEQQFADAGFSLTLVDEEDFVCRIDDKPVTDCSRTPPANAYWSLWWSDGKSGTWLFSSEGIGSLTVPEGGYVALSWQGGSGKAPPRLVPRAHPAPSPSPSSSPTHVPSAPAGPPTTSPAAPSSGPTTVSTPSPSPDTPSATALGHHDGGGRHRHGHHRPMSTYAGHADPTRGAAPGQATGSRLPGWVAPGLVAVLFALTAGVYAVRRRRSGGADA